MTEPSRRSDQPVGDTYPAPHHSGPYPVPYPYPPAPLAPQNGLGIAALSVAVLGLLASPSVLGGVALGVVAVALGFAGRARALRGEADNGGVAIAGVVLGFLAVATGIAFIVIYFSLFKGVGGDQYLHCMEQAGSNRAGQQQCADQLRDRIGSEFGVTLPPAPPKR